MKKLKIGMVIVLLSCSFLSQAVEVASASSSNNPLVYGIPGTKQYSDAVKARKARDNAIWNGIWNITKKMFKAGDALRAATTK